MFGINYETLIPVVIGVMGAAYGYLQNGKLKDIVGVTQKFAEQSVTYLGIKADGTITVEEKVKMGEAAIAFFESVEQVAGQSIVNNQNVAWIKPAETTAATTAVTTTAPVAETVTPSQSTGAFDPREHTAEEKGWDANGNYVTGLKMPPDRFKSMTAQMSAADVALVLKQVNEAEAAGQRRYMVDYSKGYCIIDNGVYVGGAGEN